MASPGSLKRPYDSTDLSGVHSTLSQSPSQVSSSPAIIRDVSNAQNNASPGVNDHSSLSPSGRTSTAQNLTLLTVTNDKTSDEATAPKKRKLTPDEKEVQRIERAHKDLQKAADRAQKEEQQRLKEEQRKQKEVEKEEKRKAKEEERRHKEDEKEGKRKAKEAEKKAKEDEKAKKERV